MAEKERLVYKRYALTIPLPATFKHFTGMIENFKDYRLKILEEYSKEPIQVIVDNSFRGIEFVIEGVFDEKELDKMMKEIEESGIREHKD